MIIIAIWNTDKPSLANNISDDIPDIEECLQELHDLLEHLTTGTLGTTTVTDFNLEFLAAAHAADHTASGVVASLTAGENVVFGHACYLKSDGKMWRTDAADPITMPIMAMAIATIAADAAGAFLLLGFARDDTWTWTIGGAIYASGVSGGLTKTAPTGTGDQIQIVGIATHADRMYFSPQKSRLLELQLKVIDISDWNMDTTNSVDVAHGLTLSKIIAIYVMVRNDDDSERIPLNFLSPGSGNAAGGWYTDATNVVCSRVATGNFDSDAYNSTTYNRGWITIWHIA